MTATDAENWLARLDVKCDARRPVSDSPRPRRAGQLRAGWNRVHSGRPISDATLRSRLTWHNLGYRLALEFDGLGDPDALFAVFHGIFDHAALRRCLHCKDCRSQGYQAS